MSDVGIVTQEAPYVLPGLRYSIISVTLSDSSITNREKSLITVRTNTDGLACMVECYGTKYPLELQSNIAGVKTWTGYLVGSEIGLCTTETVTVYACRTLYTAIDTSKELTVTQGVGVYGVLITALLEDMQTKLRNAGAGYPFLDAVPSEDITIGEKLQDYDYPLIYVAPAVDMIKDLTVGNTQMSDFRVSIIVQTMDFDGTVALEDLVDLVGDVFDLFMQKDNRVLNNLCRLNTLTDLDWASIGEPIKSKKRSKVLSWCVIEASIDMSYRSGV